MSANDLIRFPSDKPRIYQHICSKVENISIRLLGRPSDAIAGGFFSQDESPDDTARTVVTCLQRPKDREPVPKPATSKQPNLEKIDNDSESDGEDRYDQTRLLNYTKTIARSLERMSQVFVESRCLDEVAFQAFPNKGFSGPDLCDYLDFSAMKLFLNRIPSTLTYLTLDLAGTKAVSSEGPMSDHLCPIIGRCIRRVENVRLRANHICPAVFGFERFGKRTRLGKGSIVDRSRQSGCPDSLSEAPTSAGFYRVHYVMNPDCGLDGSTRLKSLIIRLHMPISPDDERVDYAEYRSKVCSEFSSSIALPRLYLMSFAASKFLRLDPGVKQLKLSHRCVQEPKLLYTSNIVMWTTEFLPEEIHVCKDDGSWWDPWENRDDLIVMPGICT